MVFENPRAKALDNIRQDTGKALSPLGLPARALPNLPNGKSITDDAKLSFYNLAVYPLRTVKNFTMWGLMSTGSLIWGLLKQVPLLPLPGKLRAEVQNAARGDLRHLAESIPGAPPYPVRPDSGSQRQPVVA